MPGMDIYSEIDIDRPASEVWRVLTDFGAYPQWNPMIPRIKGEPRVGSKVRFSIKVPGGMKVPLDAEVVVADPDRELRWVGPAHTRLRGLVSGSHYYRIEERGSAGVRLCHGEVFSGLLIPGKWPRGERTLTPMYAAFNRALKRRVEG
jgi:hypothetical protein